MKRYFTGIDDFFNKKDGQNEVWEVYPTILMQLFSCYNFETHLYSHFENMTNEPKRNFNKNMTSTVFLWCVCVCVCVCVGGGVLKTSYFPVSSYLLPYVKKQIQKSLRQTKIWGVSKWRIVLWASSWMAETRRDGRGKSDLERWTMNRTV